MFASHCHVEGHRNHDSMVITLSLSSAFLFIKDIVEISIGTFVNVCGLRFLCDLMLN